jgi:tetratricopeptide (TPR) repeat protein
MYASSKANSDHVGNLAQHLSTFPSMEAAQLNSCIYQRLFLLFFLILLIAYGNTFNAAWQLDDKPNILSNARIKITAISLDQIWQSMNAKPGSGQLYRPVACVTFALNWLLNQDDVFGYHVINFLIHLTTAWAVFLVLCTTFLTPRMKGRYPRRQYLFMAGFAALLWALNPIQTQAVTYIVQRMASLAAMFAVWSIYFYLKARLSLIDKDRIRLYLTSFLCYVLGFLSKENVVILPFSALLLEYLFLLDKQSWMTNKRIIWSIVCLAVLCWLFGFFLRSDVVNFIFDYYANRPFTLVERVLTEQRILLFYLSLLFFPAPGRLSIEHDIVLSSSLFSPWTTFTALLLNGLLIAGAVKFRKEAPLLSIAILFFYLNHLVESSILPLELIFEHRNYLPSIFLFLPIAQLINRLMFKQGGNRRLLVLTSVLATSVFILEGYATYTRNAVWRTEQSLWLDAAAKAPQSARPLATLAILLAWGDHPTPAKYRKALELTKRSLSLRMPRNLEAEQLGNLASIYEKMGQIEQAILYYEKAIAVSPGKVNNRYNLSKTLISIGDFQRARSELESIINLGFVHADYYQLLGFISLWSSEYKQALSHLNTALKLAPDRPDILLSIGNCLSTLGERERAQQFIELAEQTGGHDPIVSLNKIQNALLDKDNIAAKRYLDDMLSLFPLPKIRQVIENSNNKYRMVPLDRPLLEAFLSAELTFHASVNEI